MVNLPKSRAIERLQMALDAIPNLRQLRYGCSEFSEWRRQTGVAIAYIFGEATRHGQDFKKVNYSGWGVISDSSSARDSEAQQSYVKGLDKAESALKSMIDEIEEYWEEDEEPMATPNVAKRDGHIDEKKIFIVHGHDNGTMNTVARFLQDLELEPVILQEQSNQGLTLIEKLEQNTEVGFAVVLFTPDDIGSAKDDADTPRYRARQNVIFELGYLIRHLGRSRVSVLYKGDKGDIEIPSDYSRVLYTQIDDADGWKGRIIKEMKSAGLDIDANLAF